ncbi:hypothetical protein FRB90_008090 [Tulasnella sp. 427]|nr:hypothetical protein FRB90_008090 [Tulasnella sp. 427]
MEHFFLIPELRRMVFMFLHSKDLINCAHVCRGWKDDALDVRWRFCTVDLIDVLAQLAPLHMEEVWEEGDQFCQLYTLQTNLAEIGQEDWDEFLKLTAKVHVISTIFFVLNPDSVELIHELVKTYGCPLFPNLTSFEMLGYHPMLPSVSLCLVPGLTSIKMKGDFLRGQEDGSNGILAQLLTNCTNIKYLDMETTCATSGPTFDAFPALRVLSYRFGKFSTESWRSLGKCTDLFELELVGIELQEISHRRGGEGLELRSLRELRISRIRKRNALILLAGTRMPVLQKLLMGKDFTEEERKDLSDRSADLCPQLKWIEFC